MGEYRVHALEVLQGQSRAEEAKEILTRVAKQVRRVGLGRYARTMGDGM